jgi:hypothetical protein
LVLNKKLELGINIDELDKEIKEIEEELSKKVADATDKQSTLKKIKKRLGGEVSYIG